MRLSTNAIHDHTYLWSIHTVVLYVEVFDYCEHALEHKCWLEAASGQFSSDAPKRGQQGSLHFLSGEC